MLIQHVELPTCEQNSQGPFRGWLNCYVIPRLTHIRIALWNCFVSHNSGGLIVKKVGLLGVVPYPDLPSEQQAWSEHLWVREKAKRRMIIGDKAVRCYKDGALSLLLHNCMLTVHLNLLPHWLKPNVTGSRFRKLRVGENQKFSWRKSGMLCVVVAC